MTETIKDPVCGMHVTPQSAAGHSDYLGKTYYFCSLGCMQSFESEPEIYVEQTAPAHSHGCC